ncbi:DUF58 domain-containing protein [Porticoccaceae bacterium LTM1]|nr:DUF58 domain-containing protein [Porticoccaceae bacterium LTM1]
MPTARRIRLDQNKLFVFPSGAGFAYLFVLVVLWLLATNYQNNLVFGVAVLLSSMFITAILHSYANLAGLELQFSGAEPVFAGQNALFDILISHNGKRPRHNIRLSFKGGPVEVESLELEPKKNIFVSAYTSRRGLFKPGRVRVESVYPLGLLRVWTYLDLDCQALVYPKPIFSSVNHNQHAPADDGRLINGNGSDDFIGLKTYEKGEPLQQVAWKQYASERGLFSKQYGDAVDEQCWLDWDAFAGQGTEQRLSRLCGQALELAKRPADYGLKLPSVEITPSRGESHLHQILTALALFQEGDSR